MKKRLISLLLVFCMVFSLVPTTVFAANGQAGTSVELANPFKDVKETDWFYDAVQYARINSFFNGTSKTTFEPNGTMTRGMFVTVLGRMAGVDAEAYQGLSVFADVPADKYYAPYVAWAAKYGITTGTGEDKFSPDALINRQQMATFFVRYFETFGVKYDTAANITTVPADLASIASYAQDAVLKLWKQGLLNGDGVNFVPAGNATRAQAAALAMRTDEAVEIWYKETGIASDRVSINPETGLPFGQTSVNPSIPAPGIPSVPSVPSVPSEPDEPDDPDVPSEPEVEQFAVRFYDGSRLIDTLYAEKDQPLGAVPSVGKSSKANAFLLGYFTDAACTEPFYAENPVTADMNVYAKYEEMGTGETLNFTSFAQMDQKPDLSFAVIGSGDPAQAVTLEVMDGSDPVELGFTATDDGYLVYAPAGFNEGCSYQLHLADGWTFKDKPETIRTASFSIYMEQVENLQMNDDIIYIQDTDAIQYRVGGKNYDMLTSELITEQGGSFTYSGAAAIEVGDILCIYTGKHPEERGFDGDTLDPAYYVTAKSVSGSTVSFTAMGEDDLLKLYNIPDNFPIRVEVLPTAAAGTANINDLDEEMYALMLGADYDLAKAKSEIEVGDFISLYVSKESIQTDDDLCFGEITAYNAETGEITYEKTTKQAILDSMDLYRDIDITGDDLVTEEEKAEIEATLLKQISESGFAEDAAFMLADLITKTDGFESAGIESLVITDSQGNALSDDELQLLNLGASFELTDDIELKVELITEGEQLHYAKGTQLAVGVEAEFEVELEDDEKIAIELEATFVQEVEISPRVKGYVVPYVVFLIPIPVGANVNGTVDIKSFTAFSFEAEIFTVAPEDKEVWEQFKEIIENPKKIAEVPGMPEELAKGLNTIGDVFDKIEEIEDNMAKIKEKAEELEEKKEQYEGYAEDLEAIWDYVEANGLTTKEDWKGMCEELDKTSITSDLLEMMDLTNETELETEYYESMEALMERYCEMVEKETDWVTLLQEDLFSSPEICIYGVSISVDVDFVVRADLSLAIGSNLQYEVGKRYEFWFKFAPFFKKAGNTTMDLLDESFAFQFYVMGRLGLKAGIRAKLEVGIGSTTLANIGVALELGPYMKFWGFFVYEYEKYRPANTSNWNSDERMAGAVLMEFGLYLKMAFEAEALDGMFSYDYEFLDEEFPLLTVGEKNFYYQPNYEPEEGEIILVKDVDGNSTNGITMELPAYTLALDYVNMREGYMAIEYLDYDRFHYTVSNPNFSIDAKTGEISVNVPEDVRYMECDLTVTYKYGKLAFSTYDMSVTVPLVWTSLSTAELSEYYTAAVRVGNDADGYTTVWSKRVLKNKEFDLPTADEVKELIGWNEYKYEMGTGYNGQQTEGLTLIEDKVYDFNIDYDTYSIRVANVENADGMTESRTYYAQYGETFDFSDLETTGTRANGVYTKLSELTHNIEKLDLEKAIDSRMADILAGGVTVYANYVDDSITATFVFVGLDAEPVTMIMGRGEEASLAMIEALVKDAGLAVKEITPAVAPITASTVYQVTCGELDTEPATITFEENGGSEVADITKPYGSLIGNLPTTEKAGYTFDGWYADEALTEPFTLTKLPQGGATAYAKWTVNERTVSFHVNGGNEQEIADITVTYGEAYGELPVASRTGYGFIGWFTASAGGEQITAETLFTGTENQTLYAQWRELVDISDDIFDFGATEEYTYERYIEREPAYTFNPENASNYAESDFTIRYLHEGTNEMVDVPINAGTYTAVITRPADDYYAKFEETYNGVLTVHKADRDLVGIGLELVNSGYSSVRLELVSYAQDEYDIDPNATITFKVGSWIGEVGSQMVDRLDPGQSYDVYAYITNDCNYNDVTTPIPGVFMVDGYPTKQVSTLAVDSSAPWSHKMDTNWHNMTDTEFVISTAEELAALAWIVNSGNDKFEGDTITLAADIDLTCDEEGVYRTWVPIGKKGYEFRGTFNGNGHTISGVGIDSNDYDYLGLFGYVLNGTVKNLTLIDSYIGTSSAKANIGGIMGLLYNSVVANCVSRATVKGVASESSGVGGVVGATYSDFNVESYVVNCIGNGKVTGKYNTGGIVGWLGENTLVANCINYTEVYGTSGGYGTGGIAGYVPEGLDAYIQNSVNLGTVKGVSSVGGIIGLNKSYFFEMQNCYSAGTVYGSATKDIYVGAVIGRNYRDEGCAENSYYLRGSASNGKGDTCLGSGTAKSSEDKKDRVKLGYFYSLTGQLGGTYYQGGILIDALNAWVEEEGAKSICRWVEGSDGYPIPDLG